MTTALLATALLLGLGACAGDDPEDARSAAAAASSASPSPTPTAEPAPAATPAPSAAAPAPTATEAAPAEQAAPAFDGTVVEVSFVGGEVSTAQPRVEVPLNGQVRLVVMSDVVDEVHVHGVDEYAPLAPGAPVTYDFTASIPGIFEVELHEAGDLLFTLQVEP